MKRWHKVVVAVGVVVVSIPILWVVSDDAEGRALRQDAVAKLAGENKTRRPMLRAIGRNATTLELSTKGLAACHEEQTAKTMEALGQPTAAGEGVTALNDASRVYVVTPDGDVRTAPREELPSLRQRGFALASAEMVAQERAKHSCGDPGVKCSPGWLEEMAATYSTGDIGLLMTTLRFNKIACVGDEWEGAMRLRY